jgi:hypothetical protein
MAIKKTQSSVKKNLFHKMFHQALVISLVMKTFINRLKKLDFFHSKLLDVFKFLFFVSLLFFSLKEWPILQDSLRIIILKKIKFDYEFLNGF